MYKIMLVDDDVPMLKYLKKIIPWQSLELETPTTTYSAVTALRLFMESLPDIVVMDIGIPQISGLELVEKFKAMKSDVRVIFLTCHENFNYAKRAVELDADDYLIKDELTPEQFKKSIVNSLNSYKKSQENSGMKSFQGVIKKNKGMLKQKFLEHILQGSDLQNHDIGKMLGIQWDELDFIVGISAIDYSSLSKRFDLQDVVLLKSGIWNVAEDLANNVKGLTPLIDDEKNLYLIMNFRKSTSRNAFGEYHDFLKELQKVVYNYWNINTTFLFSEHIVNKSDIGTEILKLNDMYTHHFYDESSIGYVGHHTHSTWHLNSEHLLRAIGESIMDAFENRNRTSIIDHIDELAILAKQEYIDPRELVNGGERWIRFMEVNTEQNLVSDTFIHYFRQSNRLHEMIQLLKRKALQLLDVFEGQSHSEKHDSRLDEIDRYIIDHLSEKINSADMANYLYLNPSYFSRYFKKISGENFTDYVHNFKMKIATELVKENKDSIKMIAARLGYSDRTYFSKVFKKYTGYSPGEYKTEKITTTPL